MVRESLRVVFLWAIFPLVSSGNVVSHGEFGVFFWERGGVVMGCSLSVFSQGVSWGYGVGFWYVRSGIVCF